MAVQTTISIDERGLLQTCASCGQRNRVPFGKTANCGKCGTTLADPAEPVEVPSVAAFDALVRGSRVPVVVDFWAPWCGPCRMVSPIYDKLAEEYEGKFKFCKINVDENQDTTRKYQIMSIPMQMFFVNGKKVDEILGAVPEHTIRTMVDGLLESSATDD